MTTTLPHSGTATSEASARDQRTVNKATHDRRVICEFIAKQGARGATDQEIEVGCPDVHTNAIRARRGECWGRGFISKELGEKRATDSGKAADVWHVKRVVIDGLGMPADSWCLP